MIDYDNLGSISSSPLTFGDDDNPNTLLAVEPPTERNARLVAAAAAGAPAQAPTPKPNTELAAMLRRCGLSAANVREHGPRQWNTCPGLRELIADSEKRGV